MNELATEIAVTALDLLHALAHAPVPVPVSVVGVAAGIGFCLVTLRRAITAEHDRG